MDNGRLRTFAITFVTGFVYVGIVPRLLESLTNINVNWWLILGFIMWGSSVWLLTVKLPRDITRNKRIGDGETGENKRG